MDHDEIDVDLRNIDWTILETLEEGPHTRQQLAERVDVTGEYVYQRVELLEKLGLVHIIHEGFYELADHRAIALTDDTRARLSEHKELDESFDTVVKRLLDKAEDT